MDNARYFEIFSQNEMVHLVLPPHATSALSQGPAFQQHGIWSMPYSHFRDMVGDEQYGIGTPARIKVMPHHWDFLGNLQSLFNSHAIMQPCEAQLRFQSIAYQSAALHDRTMYMAVHHTAQFCWVVHTDQNESAVDAMLHRTAYMFTQAMHPTKLIGLHHRLPGLDRFFTELAEHFTRWRHGNEGISLMIHYRNIVGKELPDVVEEPVAKPEPGLNKLHRLLVELGEDSQDARDLAVGIAQFGLATGSELHREIVGAVNTLLEQKLKDR